MRKRARNTAGVAVICLAAWACTACGRTVIPETAKNEWDVGRLTQACEEVEPGAYYALTLDNVLFMERPRDRTGAGLLGFTLQLSHARKPDIRVGLDRQLTPVMDWNDARKAYDYRLILRVEEEPLAQRAVLVNAQTTSGAIGMARVHTCDLLSREYVFFEGEGDLTFEVEKIAREARKLRLEVPASAGRPSADRACGNASVMLLPGDEAVLVGVEGSASFGSFDDTRFGPEGVRESGKWSRYNYDNLKHAPHGALHVELEGQPALATEGTRIVASDVSCLSFYPNDRHRRNNEGAFQVALKVQPGRG
ncbi:MAG: hypothetical protein OXT09_27130 [Myxococcales bacterium]|nr:hypothetical protein [Myxococcales bacterium]